VAEFLSPLPAIDAARRVELRDPVWLSIRNELEMIRRNHSDSEHNQKKLDCNNLNLYFVALASSCPLQLLLKSATIALARIFLRTDSGTVRTIV
jgi:hypothetical protein